MMKDLSDPSKSGTVPRLGVYFTFCGQPILQFQPWYEGTSFSIPVGGLQNSSASLLYRVLLPCHQW
jgi:hypothetical protein